MKIRIKKVTALLLSCMLLFSISGCQKKRTAKEVLESSLKQSSKLKDADFSGEASYKIAERLSALRLHGPVIRLQIVRLLHPQTLRSR